jgi:hypothetical protein
MLQCAPVPNSKFGCADFGPLNQALAFPLLFLGEQSVPVFVQDTETLLQTTHIQKVNYAASAQYSVKWIHMASSRTPSVSKILQSYHSNFVKQKMHMYKVQVPCQLVGPTMSKTSRPLVFCTSCCMQIKKNRMQPRPLIPVFQNTSVQAASVSELYPHCVCNWSARRRRAS